MIHPLALNEGIITTSKYQLWTRVPRLPVEVERKYVSMKIMLPHQVIEECRHSCHVGVPQAYDTIEVSLVEGFSNLLRYLYEYDVG